MRVIVHRREPIDRQKYQLLKSFIMMSTKSGQLPPIWEDVVQKIDNGDITTISGLQTVLSEIITYEEGGMKHEHERSS